MDLSTRRPHPQTTVPGAKSTDYQLSPTAYIHSMHCQSSLDSNTDAIQLQARSSPPDQSWCVHMPHLTLASPKEDPRSHKPEPLRYNCRLGAPLHHPWPGSLLHEGRGA